MGRPRGFREKRTLPTPRILRGTFACRAAGDRLCLHDDGPGGEEATDPAVEVDRDPPPGPRSEPVGDVAEDRESLRAGPGPAGGPRAHPESAGAAGGRRGLGAAECQVEATPVQAHRGRGDRHSDQRAASVRWGGRRFTDVPHRGVGDRARFLRPHEPGPVEGEGAKRAGDRAFGNYGPGEIHHSQALCPDFVGRAQFAGDEAICDRDADRAAERRERMHAGLRGRCPPRQPAGRASRGLRRLRGVHDHGAVALQRVEIIGFESAPTGPLRHLQHDGAGG